MRWIRGSRLYHVIMLALLISVEGSAADGSPDAPTTISKSGGLTPEQEALWDMTASRATPLDVEILSSHVVNNCQVQDILFTSEVGANGANRIYCGIAWPLNGQGPFPPLLDLHGGGGKGSADRALSFAQQFNVLAISLDWGGKLPDDPDPLRTVWRSPPIGGQETVGLNSAQHEVIVACRRALDYAAEQPDVSMAKVVVYGGSWGAYYAMLLSGIDPRVTDTICIAGAGGWRDSHSLIAEGVGRLPEAQRETWYRTLDPIAYAQNTQSDVSQIAYTNDSYFWLGGLQENFKALAGPKRIVIAPNNDHGIGTQPEPIATWPFPVSILKHHLEGDPFPEVTSGSLQEGPPGEFSWKTTGPAVQTAALYFSPGHGNWRSRYWVEVPAHFDGTAWRASLPGHLHNVAGSYYVTVAASQNRVACTTVLSREGKDPQLEGVALWPGDSLWNTAAGRLAWRTSIYHTGTTLQPAGVAGFRIVPGADAEFEVLTDSALLLGPRAQEYEGIKLTVDGEGLAGTLNIRLEDDDPTRYTPAVVQTKVDYGAGQSEIVVPWSSFPAGASDQPWPFESIVLAGARPGSKPITIKSVESIPLKQYPYYPILGASQGFGYINKFTDEPSPVEQGRIMVNIGADAYKFMVGYNVGWASYRDANLYRDLPDLLPSGGDKTIVRLIQNEPAYRAVFDLPLKFYVMWTYATDYWWFRSSIPDSDMQKEYSQLYDFTRYLLQTYQGTGKVFLMGQWESDHVIMEGRDANNPALQPTAQMIDAMRRWFANRQQAIDDARNSLPEITGVEVYNYVEVNCIQPVLDNPNVQRVVNVVLPYVTVDLISYSSYNATNHTEQLPQRLNAHMDFIESKANLTGRWPYGKPVFIGEYGMPRPYDNSRAAQNLASLKACAAWGSPINLFWSIYSQLENGNSALVENNGTPNRDYYQLRDFNRKMHVLRNATRVWLDRNPTEAETRAFINGFTYPAGANYTLLANVINASGERTSNAQYLAALCQDLNLGEQIGTAWYQGLLDDLAAGRKTRSAVLSAVLDSAEFAAAVPLEDFKSYLADAVLRQEGVQFPTPEPSRSSLYQWAINQAQFNEADLPYALLSCVPDTLRAKYSLLLSQTEKQSGAFFEDFKDGAATFGPSYLIGGGEGVSVALTAGSELLEVLSTNAHTDGTTSWGIEYPKEGTIRWDTAQNRYLQAWIPWKGGGSDLLAVDFQIDGASFWQGDWWTNRIDNAEQWYHSQPTLVDVNTLANLTPGVHQLRMRFVDFNTFYGVGEDLSTLGMAIDWIRGGMPPDADVSLAQYKNSSGSATPVTCGFVGPEDEAIANNPPTLVWNPPAGHGDLRYTVSLSQDPFFRGPTTVTVHDITATHYTPAAPLDLGRWYWTVIPVNSDGISGQDLIKSLRSGGYWNNPHDYSFYSFVIDESSSRNSATTWPLYH